MTPEEFFETLKSHVDDVVDDWVVVTLGEAPDEKVQQYVIIWPSPGTSLDERAVTGRMGNEATDLTFQLTTAAPTSMGLLYTMQQVNAALTETLIGGHLIRPDVVTNRAATPLQDDTVRPSRHYMATTWQTQLTRSHTV